MKKLIFVIILFLVVICSNAKAQEYETLFTVGDTSEVYGIPGGAKYAFITITDSSVAGTDSVQATIRTGSTWTRASIVSVRDIASTALTTYVAEMIPGDATTKTYAIDLTLCPKAVLEIHRNNRTNGGTAYAPKTRLVITFQ
jgi:hypothetical protein